MEKKKYEAADMNRDDEGRLHVGEQDNALVEEVTAMDPALEVNTSVNDVQFDPQPAHEVPKREVDKDGRDEI